MTKFKVHRISSSGQATVEIIEAWDWMGLFSIAQYSGGAIFKVEVLSGPEPVQL